MDTTFTYERYQRQIILKIFGETGQQKLLQSKVLIIGAGGLGCPTLQYLTAAGVGTIGIVDDDVVSLSNLHRQVLYTVDDIGHSKAIKAKEKLQQLNPEINIIAYNERLTTQNAFAIIGSFDIIIDGTDNFASRYLINDACVLLHKPLVYGAVAQFEGQVAVFNFTADAAGAAVNYRDIFPHPPAADEVLNCAEAGVLGVLPGIIGTMQANETIKLITGIGMPLINQLITYNALTNEVYQVSLATNLAARSSLPKDEKEFAQMDYEWLCAPIHKEYELDGTTFNKLLSEKNVAVIDVRELEEPPLVTAFNYTQIPLSQFSNNIPAIEKEIIILFCQSGKRSLQAAQILFDAVGTSKKIFSLKGGIVKWLQGYQNK